MTGATAEHDTAAAGPGRVDTLLGGRVRLRQPAAGYRAGIDPVLLAAAVPARPGERVLELGCGAGAALLCLAARVPGLVLHGLDIDAAALELARENARLNAVTAVFHAGDIARPPPALRALTFDQVFFNPPFQPPDAPASPEPGRDRARRESGAGLAAWIGTALARLRPGGHVTLIHRAERLAEILALLAGPAGDIRVLPVAPREGWPARRVLVRARKGARGPLRLLAPLVVHAGSEHPGDREHYTPRAQAVLREAFPLDLGEPR